MKKRKELNALIGLGGGGGGGGSGERGSGSGGGGGGGGNGAGRKKRHPRKGSASGHRLLRTESAESSSSSGSSSDYGGGGGFGLPGARSRFAKGEYLRCCKLCYPLCAFVILAACVVACVGLVWMQIALKEDLDGLKERFRTMESNQKNSFQEIPRLTEDLLNKQKELDKINNGDMGLNKIWVNITEISKQISLLMLAVNHLKANIKSASDLINLPATVEDLQKSVATIGSTVTSVHHDVETMQAAIEAHKKSLQALQNEMSEHTEDVKRNQLSSFSSSSVPQTSEKNLTDTCKQDNQYLHTSLEEVNSTLMLYQKLNDLKLLSMDSTISNLSWRVTSLESHMMVVNKLEKKENLTLGVVGDLTTSANAEHEARNETTTEKLLNMEKTENGESQVSKLREKLQQISSLSRKPENDRSEALKKVGKLQSTPSKPTKLPRLSSRSVGSNFERRRHPRSLSLPGISNIEDLQDLFRTTNQGTDGKLSYEDLQNLVEATIHDSRSFKEFDTDGDDKYTLQELRVALGL